MRKALAVVVVLVLMPFVLASAAAQPGGQRVVTIRDAETEAVVRAVAHPLFRAAGLDPAAIRITLLQAWAINAFVTTGNRLFIHTGLIQQTESVAEFAGVLAHETGHIAGGHVSRIPEELRAAMLRQAAAMLLGGVAAAAAGGRGGGELGIGIAMAGQHAALQDLLAYTRAQEQAADQAAVGLLARSGWSGAGLVRLLERILDQENLQASRQDPYLRTHPLSRDRLDFLREETARLGEQEQAVPAGLEARYAMVRAKLDGFLDRPELTFRRYPATDTGAPARYARAAALHRAGRRAEAVAVLDGLIRERPSDPYLHELKGQVLFEGGRVRESLASYGAASRLAPQEALIRAGHGRALIEAGDPASLRLAARELEQAVTLDRELAFAWRLLATARGRAEDRAGADLALAEEAMLLSDFTAARTLATRAEPRLPPGPPRQRARDILEASRRENLSPEMRAAEEEARRRRERR
ncbi:M48 family metalloprotease [Neoroseomonas soli]|uniref:M48 family metalloprotease n=1 Tax=Neoroseomonas soli TaxID=1081025 RepID=A0A9X9X3M3_9PROT|nr:M48 family metalloprotease [Neoroseomonas soli]MBR0674002.1 M48 family metalloprotease [Neoroseomonas soli]